MGLAFFTAWLFTAVHGGFYWLRNWFLSAASHP